MDLNKITLIGNRVLIEIKPKAAVGKIVIPDSVEERRPTGEGFDFVIIARGNGPGISPELQVGKRVLPPSSGYVQIHSPEICGEEPNKRKIAIFAAEDILIVLPD
jgi:hypothetical protein